MMTAVQMSNVSVEYRSSGKKALDGISIEVEEGEMLLLLGRNNSGKSTFCRLLNGLIPHSIPATLTGSVRIFGKDVQRASVASLSTMVGIVFQEPESQLFCMSAEEEVAFGPENLATPREEIASRVEWALELVGLKGYNSRSPSSLSGGEMQRLAIAAALSMRPRMIVLDEPANALDPVGRRELYALLVDLNARHGMTVVIAERDAEEAASFADRIVLMSEGRIVRIGTPKEVLAEPDAMRSIGVPPPQLSEFGEALFARIGAPKMEGITLDEVTMEVSSLLGARRESG